MALLTAVLTAQGEDRAGGSPTLESSGHAAAIGDERPAITRATRMPRVRPTARGMPSFGLNGDRKHGQSRIWRSAPDGSRRCLSIAEQQRQALMRSWGASAGLYVEKGEHQALTRVTTSANERASLRLSGLHRHRFGPDRQRGGFDRRCRQLKQRLQGQGDRDATRRVRGPASGAASSKRNAAADRCAADVSADTNSGTLLREQCPQIDCIDPCWLAGSTSLRRNAATTNSRRRQASASSLDPHRGCVRRPSQPCDQQISSERREALREIQGDDLHPRPVRSAKRGADDVGEQGWSAGKTDDE